MLLNRIRLWSGMLVLGAAPLGAAINESAPLVTEISRAEVIPAEVTSHGMFVSAMINGQGPFRMEVDTGCSFSMISPEVAAAVEARGVGPEEDESQAVNGLGDVVTMPRVILDSVMVGGVQFKGVVAGVIPLELQSKIDSRALDGLLGFSLFSDLFFAMDFPKQSLVLSDAWPKDLPPVRAELKVVEHSEVPFIAVNLQGHVFEAMIDTGSNDRLHLPPDDADSLEWESLPRPGLLVAAAGETGREQVGRLSGTLELGAVRQIDPVVDVSGGNPTIGDGLLHSFCLVFSEEEDRLWLCSQQDGPLPSPSERSVGLSMIAENGGWRVAGIIPGSPAEGAGIAAGDLVTEIEGRPARNWTRDQFQNWMDTHQSVALRIFGSAGERDISLRVWLLVP